MLPAHAESRRCSGLSLTRYMGDSVCLSLILDLDVEVITDSAEVSQVIRHHSSEDTEDVLMMPAARNGRIPGIFGPVHRVADVLCRSVIIISRAGVIGTAVFVHFRWPENFDSYDIYFRIFNDDIEVDAETFVGGRDAAPLISKSRKLSRTSRCFRRKRTRNPRTRRPRRSHPESFHRQSTVCRYNRPGCFLSPGLALSL